MYVSSYKTARSVASFISGFGWLVTAIGVFPLLYTMFTSSSSQAKEQWPAFAVMGAIIVIGQIVVALGQITRAVVDTADHTGRLADIFERIDAQDRTAEAREANREPSFHTIPAG